METKNKTYADILSTVKSIDTTANGGNGYPRHLKVAYTADTMGELRELHEAATAEGHEVDVVMLHRRDGWALWERHNRGSEHDLDDKQWMEASGQDWVVVVDNKSSREEIAFQEVCGEGYDVPDVADLIAKAKQVQSFAEELPDPDGLEDGEMVVVFLRNGDEILYTVKTGQNGYSYDTHQYCTALIITERDEEDED